MIRVVQWAMGEAEQWVGLTRDRHRRMCREHRYDYVLHLGERMRDLEGRHVMWEKVRVLQEALVGTTERDVVVWMDADTLWVEGKLGEVLGPGDVVGMVAHEGGLGGGDPWHLNAGVIWVRGGYVGRQLLRDVWHDGGRGTEWLDQGGWNNVLRNAQWEGLRLVHPQWNCTPRYLEAVGEDAVKVLAWHGYADRERLMREAIRRCEPTR